MKTVDSVMREIAESDNSELKNKYLTFFTDSQLFGVPIADVVQIVGMQDITPIPEYPYYAKGVIDLRGAIIPVIDVRLRFNKPEIDYNDRTCIIVTNIRERYFGFVVDEVDEVTEITGDYISPPPQMGSGMENEYLTGVARHEDKIVLLIDAAKILGESEFDALEQAAV